MHTTIQDGEGRMDTEEIADREERGAQESLRAKENEKVRHTDIFPLLL